MHTMEKKSIMDVTVTWRDRNIKVEMDAYSSVGEFGRKLQSLTKVKAETMQLLVPQPAKGSKLITPFSDEYSNLSLQEIAIPGDKPIRMMGVFEAEIEEVSQNRIRQDLRIRSFNEEEERMRQRLLTTPDYSLKLPQGQYIFCDFCTLHIPGIELNPPPSEALRRMHMLACDPGIIAIMNKHRWRVGIMTEMAPVGYVGISPKCMLGFNKNSGEEISLRLRTDDLKGFRKYESIKKTLLHELAHMVYSEHDAKFYALDKQLNKEADSLDWTRSGGRTLSGQRASYDYEHVLQAYSSLQKNFQKLGGSNLVSVDARQSSVAAAYNRLLTTSTNELEEEVQMENENADQLTENVHQFLGKSEESNVVMEPDPDDHEMQVPYTLMTPLDSMQVDGLTGTIVCQSIASLSEENDEPDPDDGMSKRNTSEPDPDDCLKNKASFEPDPDDSLVDRNMNSHREYESDNICPSEKLHEPDLNDSGTYKADLRRGWVPGSEQNLNLQKTGSDLHMVGIIEPVPNEGEAKSAMTKSADDMQHDTAELKNGANATIGLVSDGRTCKLDEDLNILEEPGALMCQRLQKAIGMLRVEATPAEAAASLQTLIKIIRNVIDHPGETRFRRIRKTNPLIQRSIAKFKAAIEVLRVVGFCEDVIADELGRRETYLILKRNDPGLLWLAKSSLEVSTSS